MKINAKMKKKIVKVNNEWIKFNKSCFFFFLRIILTIVYRFFSKF